MLEPYPLVDGVVSPTSSFTRFSVDNVATDEFMAVDLQS